MLKIVLLRHGQSLWNQQELFTGWTDVDLTELGRQQARQAGQKLKARGFVFDQGFTSCLQRTKLTMELVLEELETSFLVTVDWRLNERHYGNLQGLNKVETAEQFGAEQVKLWRRSYDVRPPEISDDNQYNQKKDPYYIKQGIPVPSAESLADVVERVVPFWQTEIVPLLAKNQRIIIVASGNSLRALIKYLDQMTAQEILEFELPTGQPLVYQLDNQFQPIKRYYL